MSARDRARWLRQWLPFGALTIGYGTASCTLGPLTRDRRASAWCQRAWSKSSLKTLAISADLEGEHLVPAGGFMYAANHQSLLDILVLSAVLPGDVKWATKRSIMKVPFLGWHLSLAGHVPVDRKAGSRAAAQTIKRFKGVLEQGKVLLVFPEGTRSDDGSVKAFKNGGFYAAVRANTPVVPVALDGTYFLMRKHASYSGSAQDDRERDRRRVRIRIGEPISIPSEGKEKEKVAVVRDAAHAAVLGMHAELRRQSPWMATSR